MKARSIALACLVLLTGGVFGEEEKENIERMLEVYRRAGSANMELRLREYEALQEMRRERRERHLPAGSQFSFARESFRLRRNTPGETDANGCEWTSAGPTNLNGRVISIAVDPSDNQRIYAATVGGLWRSVNAGRRWQRVSDDLMADRWGAVAVNPGKPEEVLAAMGDANMGVKGEGLWRSNSFGAPGTWTKVTPEKFNNKIVYRIRFDPVAKPDGTHDVYVAASNGVWLGEHDASGEIIFTQKPLGDLDALTAHTSDVAVDFTANP